MGETSRIAQVVREVTGIECDFQPLWIARAAGLFLCPVGGPDGVAAETTQHLLCFNDQQAGWEYQVANVASGMLLMQHGAPDTAQSRDELAALLGCTPSKAGVSTDHEQWLRVAV